MLVLPKPVITPLVEDAMVARPFTEADKSPKSVVFPVVAIAIYCITFVLPLLVFPPTKTPLEACGVKLPLALLGEDHPNGLIAHTLNV
tara:strand:+ start:571 stop:834 length:264 start_codon:yes stop_codon:yes gene_type:complete